MELKYNQFKKFCYAQFVTIKKFCYAQFVTIKNLNTYQFQFKFGNVTTNERKR